MPQSLVRGVRPVNSSRKPRAKRLEYMPGRLILRVKVDAVRSGIGAGTLSMTAKSAAAMLPDAVSEQLRYLQDNAGLERAEPLFASGQPALRGFKGATAAKSALGLLSSIPNSTNEDLAGYCVLTVDPNRVNEKLLEHIGAARGIEIVERMPARYISAIAADPQLNLQWGLRAMRWFQASRPDAASVRVAVLDTGIDKTHPDLKANIDNYEHAGASAADLLGHGTHVAGTIAAAINNGVGVAGVAGCRLMIWKIFGDTPDESDGEFYVDDLAYLRALADVRNSGARVLNLSIGGTASSRTERRLFDRLGAAGVTVVAAMGNEFEEGNPTSFPAAYRGVLAVGALGADLRRAKFSNTGPHIAVSAPGVQMARCRPKYGQRW